VTTLKMLYSGKRYDYAGMPGAGIGLAQSDRLGT
jgi:hypothetical protein